MDWHTVASTLLYLLAVLLCLIGIILSCVSLSGTWSVLLATGLLAWIRRPSFPGIWCLLAFLLLCIAIEISEALAASWGVAKRGGSKTAGWAALCGGMIGMVLGTLIPIPIIGTLIGMMAGSFGLAFLVERHQMKKSSDHAAHIAFGAVLARLAVLLLKVGATLTMIAILVLGILLD